MVDMLIVLAIIAVAYGTDVVDVDGIISVDDDFNSEIFWKGEFGRGIERKALKRTACGSNDDATCIEWSGGTRLRLTRRTSGTVGHGTAETASVVYADGVNCTDVYWEAPDCRLDVFEDCFDLSTSHWYGGTVTKQMYWPVELISVLSQPYVVNDAFAIDGSFGSVLERYWLNSDGLAIYVDWEVPLWVSVNATGDRKLCLKAQYRDSPYNNFDDAPLSLNYTVCRGLDVRHVHDHMSAVYLDRPVDIPDERMFTYPIWSTWAQYKDRINQTKVLEYADQISANGFDNSQLEIDDRWETSYGDLMFDAIKFPDPRSMVGELSRRGFRVTLWVHPFVNLDSDAVLPGLLRLAFISDPGGILPALASWWTTHLPAMVVDFTSDVGTNWYRTRLERLQNDYNISSFKIDAGENNYLPNCYRLSDRAVRNPCVYSAAYAEMALTVDSETRHQEIRVGAQTQHLPLFVRMLDKDSRWGYDNGIETVIPHVLNFGIIGYPFVLPDMVGGNAYGIRPPDRELFVRWVELNVFLPSIQYSIAPWDFDAEVLTITRAMTDLHQQYAAPRIIALAREATVTGAPINRPLWWIAPTDPVALSIDSEFLLGDDLLVAPVVKQAARSRDIYLPAGLWYDELRQQLLIGGRWLYDYVVELNELPYFTRRFNVE